MSKNLYLDGIMGLVVGDAVGVPVEFSYRKDLKENPVTDMRQYGTHQQPKGAWSDDSSMALANLASLHRGYDLKDIAEQFSRWDKEEIYTPMGAVFDMGMTCSRAIRKFQDTGDVKTCGMYGEEDNGNGSLMRIMPMCIYVYELQENGLSDKEAIQMIHDVSALTHGHLRSKMACGLYYFVSKEIIDHRNEKTLLECMQAGFDKGFAFYRKDFMNLVEMSHFARLTNMAVFQQADEDTIESSGYVLHTIEAAIWSLLNSDTYKSAILKAVNLGRDTDTTAAVAGGLAGLYYGYDAIPEDWRKAIIQKEWIEELCDLSYEKAERYEGRIVDCHSHFMPEVDDGSTSMEMSVEMLKLAEKEGVTDLFLTSHGDYVCEEIEEYHKKFELLKEEAKKKGISINLYEGCEVFCELTTWDFEGDEDDIEVVLYGLDNGLYPTYNGTKFVLTEFDIGIQPADALYMVKRIQSGGYTPVLAHVERYPFLIQKHFVDDLVREGCLVQINAYSLTEEKTDIFKKNARYLLGRKLVHFLGSDAHRSDHRPPRMNSGVQYVWKNCDEEYAKDIIYRNAEKYLIS